MNKRVATSLLAVLTTLSVVGGVAPAALATSTACAPYPPGQPFHVHAYPSRATVHAGSQLVVESVVTRGAAEERCYGQLVSFRYYAHPWYDVASKRTDAQGRAFFVTRRIFSRTPYLFSLRFNNGEQQFSNTGIIYTRSS
ncbi:MAG: hypothetical protein WCD35_11015 [Mycobacteriales bacterium]